MTVINGTDDSDKLGGTHRSDVIFGDDAQDAINGQSGSDRIHGGNGDDQLFGASGNDVIFGASRGVDTIDFNKFRITEDVRATVTFNGETAGYKNTVGFYKIGEDGTISDVQILFANASERGSGGNLVADKSSVDVKLEAGDQLGFFILPNAYSKSSNQSVLSDRKATYEFVNADGEPGNISDAGDLVLVATTKKGGSTKVETQYGTKSFHTYSALNSDGINHATGVVTVKDGVVRIGFEDLLNGGDNDFDDSIFTIDIGLTNAALLPREKTSDVTASDNDVISGGSGNDKLYGLRGDDDITGDSGNDYLNGGSGNDRLDGGSNNDELEGGSGNDALIGRDGNDELSGGSGDDQLDGGHNNDELSGGSGDDKLVGGTGDDTLVGGVGDDAISGGENNDVIEGNSGNDILSGDGGQDRVSGNDGDDTIYGGLGNDRLDGGVGNDVIFGGEGNDQIEGNSGNDELSDGDGNDKVSGDSGDDTFFDGLGRDEFDGGSGDDVFFADAGGFSYDKDKFIGGSGFDTLNFELSGARFVEVDLNDKEVITHGVSGSNQNAQVSADVDGIEAVVGTDGDDTFKGDKRDNTFVGGAGDDEFRGLAGVDTFVGGVGADVYVWFGKDVVDQKTNAHLGVDRILDFNASEGDTLNVRAITKELDYEDLSEVLKAQDGVDGVTLSLKIEGQFVDVVTLDDTTSAELLGDGVLYV